MRFRCLLKHRVLHYAPTVASKIINSCTILHNMCVQNKIDFQPDYDMDLDIDLGVFSDERPIVAEAAVGRINPDLMRGKLIQRRLIFQKFFLSLV